MATSVRVNVGVEKIENPDGTFSVQVKSNSHTIVDGITSESSWKVRQEWKFESQEEALDKYTELRTKLNLT